MRAVRWGSEHGLGSVIALAIEGKTLCYTII
jgi:hypothetical protein